MNKLEFIDYFIEVVKNVLLKELPAEAEESEFTEKSYDLVSKKVRHIKTKGANNV